ncbi:hypothetical protein HWI79_2812 [Cryptosporidium felis]|nr:hypothetical protein HWI79_2812 [Cryptosporidium felis]
MRPSVTLSSSVRRRFYGNNYAISSGSEVENENLNTPVRILNTNLNKEYCHSDSSGFNKSSSRPSICLTTSVRRKIYHVDSSDESFTEEPLEVTQKSPLQPCINFKSEFEPNNTPSFSAIIYRRRNYVQSSEEEDPGISNSRPSIKYQSSVRRKNYSKKIYTVIGSDSDEDSYSELFNRRSSLCLGPELINEVNCLNGTPESRSVWKSIDSELDISGRGSSPESFQEFEWKTAFSSYDFNDEKEEREDFIATTQADEYRGKVGAEGEMEQNYDLKKEEKKEYNLFSDDLDLKEEIKDRKKRNRKKGLMNGEKQAEFVRQRTYLAKSWYQRFNQQVFRNRLPEEVPIKWTGRLQRTAAQTLFITNIDGSRKVVIKLSKYVLDSEFRLKKTLLHECCHVAQFLLDFCIKPPHGQIFLKWGNLATRIFPELKVEIYHNYEIIYKYRYQCMRCFQMFGRQTKINDETKIVCSICNGTVIFIGKGAISNNNRSLEQKPQTGDMQLTPVRHKPNNNPYSAFVKEKFAHFKREMREGITPSRRAPSIMKEIAKLWKQKKSSDLISEFEKLSIKENEN